MAEPVLSTTSYAILGYLAVRPWTAYELTKQLGRSFHHFWPRAESGIYREFKRLTAAGLAVATVERDGGRVRSRYALTEAGRAALDAWLAEPTSEGFLESEGLVRLLFSDRMSPETTLRLLDEMARRADGTAAQMAEAMDDYLENGGPFPERAHVNVLIARFLIDFAEMVSRWRDWSATVVEDWPDELPARTIDDERIRSHIRSTINVHRRRPAR
jgi:PadR family transcriptional regulator, regulatory protein AphA